MDLKVAKNKTLFPSKYLTMSGIFIVAAKRTPFGKFGGSLKKKTITDLSEIALKAALAQAGFYF